VTYPNWKTLIAIIRRLQPKKAKSNPSDERQYRTSVLVGSIRRRPSMRIYLSKLPRFEKKLRVAFDWTLDPIFSKDLVQFWAFALRFEWFDFG